MHRNKVYPRRLTSSVKNTTKPMFPTNPLQQNSSTSIKHSDTISGDIESLPVDTRREFVFVSDTGRQGGISGTGVPKS